MKNKPWNVFKLQMYLNMQNTEKAGLVLSPPKLFIGTSPDAYMVNI